MAPSHLLNTPYWNIWLVFIGQVSYACYIFGFLVQSILKWSLMTGLINKTALMSQSSEDGLQLRAFSYRGDERRETQQFVLDLISLVLTESLH